MRDMERKRAHDRARMAQKYTERTTHWQRHPELRCDYIRRWNDLTLKGATRHERAGMTPEEQSAYLAEFDAAMGKSFLEIVLGKDHANAAR